MILSIAENNFFILTFLFKHPVNITFYNLNLIFNVNMIIILIGLGYNQSTESDILLLDISNNDEYVWII